MKHIAVCIAAVVAVATPALAQQGAQSQQPNAATSGHARSQVTGRFSLEIANGNDGALNRVGEDPSDDSDAPALNNQAATQARTTAPQVQLPPPQTVTQSRQTQTQPRVRPNP